MRCAAALLLVATAFADQRRDTVAVVGSTGAHACAMWDFSWLTRRQAPEAEFANLTAVLDGLAARGYDCVRIDAFPHLVAAGPDGTTAHDFVVLAQKPDFMWGNHHEVSVNPRAGLIEFITLAAARGIGIGLSAWYNPDSTGRSLAIAQPADLTRVWAETLGFLADHHLLGAVLWVDLCNEFPLGQWVPTVYENLFHRPWDPATAPKVLGGEWSLAMRAAVDGYLVGSITPLQHAFPALRFSFSLQALGSANMVQQNFSSFGAAEVHLWACDSKVFLVESQAVLMFLPLPEFPKDLQQFAKHVAGTPDRSQLGYYSTHGEDLAVRTVRERLQFWKGWADRWELPLFTTEAWGPINYDDVDGDVDHFYWEWVKDIGAKSVLMAKAMGWSGIATSNFAEPHFPGMWQDVAWHANLTGVIRGDTMERSV